jgi:hypothetical protein
VTESNVTVASPEVFALIFNRWKTLRYEINAGQKIQHVLKVIQLIQGEEMSANPDADPYVCFRRREIKMNRKGRRGDANALEKLRKLREDLQRTKEILDILHDREMHREYVLTADQMVFEKRIYVRRIKKILGLNTPDLEATPEKPRKRIKRTIEDSSESTIIRIPAHRLRDAANLISEIDFHSMMESINANEWTNIEERARRQKLMDEKNGWFDMTEVITIN